MPRYSFGSLDAKGGSLGTEYEYYTDPAFAWGGGYPANGQFSVSSGILTVTAQTTPASLSGKLPDRTIGVPYAWVSGVLTTQQSFNVSGPFYAEERAKVPKGQGSFPAFWFLRQDLTYPPEIDGMETVNDGSTLYSSIHYGSPQTDESHATSMIDLSAAFHNYGFEYTGATFNWWFDGVLIYSRVVPGNFNIGSMYLLLNLAVGNDSAVGPPDGTTPNPMTLQVDWVKVRTP